MATPDDNLRALLLTQSTVTAIVADRICQDKPPQQERTPYIIYSQTGCTDDAALDDSAGVPTRFLFEISCVSPVRGEARNLVNIVHGILNKYRGTYGDTTCKGIFAEQQDDRFERLNDLSDKGRYVCTVNAEVVL